MSRLAAGQDLVIDLDQLLAAGLTATAVHKRVAAGRWYRVHRCVYALVPPSLLSRRGHLIAAVLACGEGAVLSHRSAAELLDLVARWSARPEIHVTAPRRRTVPGVTAHRSTTLTTADVTRLDGIACTAVARTLLHLGDHGDGAELEHALDRAQAGGRLRGHRRPHPGGGGPGVSRGPAGG